MQVEVVEGQQACNEVVMKDFGPFQLEAKYSFNCESENIQVSNSEKASD